MQRLAWRSFERNAKSVIESVQSKRVASSRAQHSQAAATTFAPRLTVKRNQRLQRVCISISLSLSLSLISSSLPSVVIETPSSAPAPASAPAPTQDKADGKPAESKPTDSKPTDSKPADAAAPATPSAGVKRVAIKVGGGKVSISTSALSDEEVEEINKLFAPLLRLASAYEKSSAGAIRKYDEIKRELLTELPASITNLKALLSSVTSLSGKDTIGALKTVAPQAEKLVSVYKQYTALSISPAEAVSALRAALSKYFAAIVATKSVVAERASAATKEAANTEFAAASTASEEATKALNEHAAGVSLESGWPEYTSQLRAFAKELEEQQQEAKNLTGATLDPRAPDDLIEVIPLVAHLGGQVLKLVANFGEAKYSDEQKAGFAIDGLSLGEQLAKEVVPRFVKESILVALGTDSVDARNRMLMASKKIAAVCVVLCWFFFSPFFFMISLLTSCQSLVELAKYAQTRFASKGTAPTDEEAEEAEIIGGGIKASMGILMDTATGLKEGRREMFARSPSPLHRRPSGIGLGSGGSSSALGM